MLGYFLNERFARRGLLAFAMFAMLHASLGGVGESARIDTDALRERLTVTATSADMRFPEGRAKPIRADGGEGYAEMRGSPWWGWRWPTRQLLPDLRYSLNVRLGRVADLAAIPGARFRLAVHNPEGKRKYGYAAAVADGRRIETVVSRQRLKEIGDGTGEVTVGEFRPASFAGYVSLKLERAVLRRLGAGGRDFPRIHEFRFEPVLEGKTEEELRAIKNEWEARRVRSGESGGFGVEARLEASWTVFGPFGEGALEGADPAAEAVPETVAAGGDGVSPREVTPEGNRIDLRDVFEDFPVRSEALVFIPVTVAEAGPVTFGFGADWWFEAWVDGEPLLETVTRPEGNEAWPPSPSNHTVSRWMEAGKHLLAVRVIAGRNSAVLTVGGPNELSELGPNQWDPVKTKAAEQLGPEVVPDGDFEEAEDGAFPSAWQNGKGTFAFVERELRWEASDAISGERSLHLDTTGSGASMRKLSVPLKVDPTSLYRIAASVRHEGGDGYVSITVQHDTGTGPTEYLLAEGEDLRLYQRGEKTNGVHAFEGFTYFDEPEPYLVIRTHGPVRATIDAISIRAASDSRRFTGHGVQRHPWSEQWFDVELSDAVTTPHTDWAAPLTGGPLEVAALMPFWHGRHLVELGQRISLESTFLPFNGHNDWTNDWWVRDERGEPTVFRARKRVMDTLRSGSADVFLVWELSASTLDAASVDAILEEVRSGAGVVITGFGQHYYPYPDGKGEAAFEAFNEGAWGRGLNAETRVHASKAAPEFYEGSDARVDYYRYGEGRIALVRSIEARGAEPDSREAYEQRMAGVARLLRWAGRGTAESRLLGLAKSGNAEPRAELTFASPEEAAKAEWVLDGAIAEGDRLRWWIHRAAGEEALTEGVMDLSAERRRYPWALPEPLPGGDAVLNAQLVRDGRVVDWRRMPLRVARSAAIDNVAVEGADPFLRADQPIRGTVRLTEVLPEGTSLAVRLEDVAGRLWGRETFASGGPRFAFDFGQVPARSLVHRVVAELTGADGRQLAEAKTSFSVARTGAFYDRFFDQQIWQIPGDYIGGLAAQQYRSLGITSTFWGKGSTRPVAEANIRAVPSLAQNHPPRMRVRGENDAPEMVQPLTREHRLNQMKQSVRREMRDMDGGKWAPLAYGQGHESNMRGFTTRTMADVDFSPSALRSFRGFARGEYESLDALNAAWGTEFADWASVRPMVLDEAVRADDKAAALARWIQHRRHMDQVYLSYMKEKRAAAREFVPGIQATHDNYYGTDSFSGVDLWQQVSELVAGSGIGNGILPSFTPPERKHLVMHRNAAWHPHMETENDDLMAVRFGLGPWQHLLLGYHGTAYWTGHFSRFPRVPNGNFAMPIQPDLRLTSLGKWAAAEVRRIREGIDRMAFAGERDDSGIAVLYSRASEHAATAWQGLNFRDQQAQKLWPESEAEAAISLLRENGYQYRRIADAQIRRGALKEDDVRLLILPFSQAVSPEAAERIRAFVRGGGRVLADLRPGVVNARGESYDEGVLDPVFGVRQDTSWGSFHIAEVALDLDFVGASAAQGAHTIPKAWMGSGVEPTGARGLAETNKPVFLAHTFGRGEARLLNLPFSRLGDAGTELFADLLSGIGMAPLFELEVLSGPAIRNTEETTEIAEDADLVADGEGFMGESGGGLRPRLFRHVFGDIDLLGISSHRQRKGAGRERHRVVWPEEGHVYNLRNGDYRGVEKETEIEMAAEGVSVFAVVPFRIEAPEVEATTGSDAEGRPVVRAVARLQEEAEEQSHVIQFELRTPDGGVWFDLPETRMSEDGRAEYAVTLPLNAPEGEWTLVAREAISRLETETTFQVERRSDAFPAARARKMEKTL